MHNRCTENINRLRDILIDIQLLNDVAALHKADISFLSTLAPVLLFAVCQPTNFRGGGVQKVGKQECSAAIRTAAVRRRGGLRCSVAPKPARRLFSEVTHSRTSLLRATAVHFRRVLTRGYVVRAISLRGRGAVGPGQRCERGARFGGDAFCCHGTSHFSLEAHLQCVKPSTVTTTAAAVTGVSLRFRKPGAGRHACVR